MKNAIFISTDLPDSDKKGFQIVLYNRLSMLLNLGFHIKLYVISLRSLDVNYTEDKILSHPNLEVFILKPSMFDFFKALVSFCFLKIPLQVSIYNCSVLKKKLLQDISSRNVSFLCANLIRVVGNCKNLPVPVLLDAVDSMSLNFERRKSVSSMSKGFLLDFELRRLKHFEMSLNWLHSIHVVSNLDLSFFGNENLYSSHLGVDLPNFTPVSLPGKPSLIFTGNMFYKPNSQAIHWFIDEIFPDVLSKYPNCRLYVVGRGSLNLKINNKSINCYQDVDNMADYIGGADASLAPMISGSGMQFKILEALAVGIPVITTKVGLGDIKAKENIDLFVFNDSLSFLNSLDLALTNSSADSKKSRIDYVLNNHNWDMFNSYFLNCVKSL